MGGGTPELTQLQLNNMRRALAQNPEMAEVLINQIAASDPEALRQLGANPRQAIAQILQSGGDEDDGDDPPVPPGTHVLSVTAEERAAIARVCIPCLSQESAQPYGFSLIAAGSPWIQPAASYRSLLCVR